MFTFGSQLKKHRDVTSLSQEDIALRIGETQANYNSIENGRRTIKTAPKLLLLAQIKELQLSFEQLCEMVEADGVEVKLKDDIIKNLKGSFIKGDVTPTELPSELNRLPILGHVTGGPLDLVEQQYADDFIQVDDGKEAFGLIVRGKSMAPGIPDGARIIVQRIRPNKFRNGVVYVVENTDYEATCKRLVKAGRSWELTPDNPIYEAKPITMSEVRRVFEVMEVRYRP